jgi:Flp pilus assembly protein TadG
MNADLRTGPADRRGTDRGSVSLFIVVLVPALLIAAGLVLDGGRQLHARREAEGAASAAARAAVQLTADEARHAVDGAQATARAERTLAALGRSGDVRVEGDTVTVTVTAEVDNLILPGSRIVVGAASAVPSRGIGAGG